MRKKAWSEYEVMKLKELYPHCTCNAVASHLGRTPSQIYGKAHQLGLSKTDEFYMKHGGRTDGFKGRDTRFEKGMTPWNKGKKVGAHGRTKDTMFKPGNKPHTWRPIGHTRENPDGYLERKIQDTRLRPKSHISNARLRFSERFQ